MMDSTNGFLSTEMSYTKNKLRTAYLSVPLMLEFNTSTNPKRSFHLAAGVIGNWRMGASIKNKYQEEGIKYEEVKKSSYNLRYLTLDASVRIGYGNVTLFAVYGLTTLFEENEGPEVYPLTVGVSLIPW
jgi:hypothetical protein